MKVYLMNKDICLAKLNLSTYSLKLVKTYNTGFNIFFLKSDATFQRWLSLRQTPFNRHYMADVYKFTNINNTFDFVTKSQLLSVTDCFWVKTSNKDTWDSVNLYDNSFNSIISRMSLGEHAEYIYSNRLSSPEFTSGGSFPKTWKHHHKDIYMYKGSLPYRSNELYNSHTASEILMYEIAIRLGYDCVRYSNSILNNIDVCVCKSFTNKNVGFLPIVNFIGGEPSFTEILGTVNRKLHRHLCEMFLLDSLCFNVDRHTGNYGFLFNTDTFTFYGLSPIFDNNWALFPNKELVSLSNSQLNNLVNKSVCKVTGETFTTLGYKCIVAFPELRESLKRLDYFNFSNYVVENCGVSKERIAVLLRIVKAQANLLLKLTISID